MLEPMIVQAAVYLGLCAVSPELIIEATPSVYRGGNTVTYFAV